MWDLVEKFTRNGKMTTLNVICQKRKINLFYNHTYDQSSMKTMLKGWKCQEVPKSGSFSYFLTTSFTKTWLTIPSTKPRFFWFARPICCLLNQSQSSPLVFFMNEMADRLHFLILVNVIHNCNILIRPAGKEINLLKINYPVAIIRHSTVHDIEGFHVCFKHCLIYFKFWMI